MYATLTFQAERLFPQFEPITIRLPPRNFTIAPAHPHLFILIDKENVLLERKMCTMYDVALKFLTSSQDKKRREKLEAKMSDSRIYISVFFTLRNQRHNNQMMGCPKNSSVAHCHKFLSGNIHQMTARRATPQDFFAHLETRKACHWL